jgi:hypothetical protein
MIMYLINQHTGGYFSNDEERNFLISAIGRYANGDPKIGIRCTLGYTEQEDHRAVTQEAQRRRR